MSASIVAEVALLNFDRLEVKELEEKLNKNFRGKRDLLELAYEPFNSV